MDTAGEPAQADGSVIEGLRRKPTRWRVEIAISSTSTPTWSSARWAARCKSLLREEGSAASRPVPGRGQIRRRQLDDYDAVVQSGFRKLQDLIRLRKRWAGQITEQRYSDMAYRIFQNDALQKYRQQFDLAQQYTYLTAAAYDYETNLARRRPGRGGKFLREIVASGRSARSRWTTGPWDVEPIVGLGRPGGAAGQDARQLRGAQGPDGLQQPAGRGEPLLAAARAVPAARYVGCRSGGRRWQRYYTPNIYADPIVAEAGQAALRRDRAAARAGHPVRLDHHPEGLNYFGWPLGPGDSAYDASQFATKIASVGVWFEGYDTSAAGQHAARLPAAGRQGRGAAAQHGGRAALLERDRAAAARALSDRRGGHAEPELDRRASTACNGRMFCRSSPTPACAPIRTPTTWSRTETEHRHPADRPVGVEHPVGAGDPRRDAAGRSGAWASIASSRTWTTSTSTSRPTRTPGRWRPLRRRPRGSGRERDDNGNPRA